MKERLDKILMLVIYFYAVICILGLITCNYKLRWGIYDFINSLSFNEIKTLLWGDLIVCAPLVFDYFQFLVLGTLITTRYLIFAKTYQK